MSVIPGIKPMIVGAPFGNYRFLQFPGFTPTLGTFTLRHRSGVLKRWWRMISTVRPKPGIKGWINRLGLPNPGIDALPDCTGKIVSVYGFYPSEWPLLVKTAGDHNPLAVELNLSCPNLSHDPVVSAEEAASAAVAALEFLPASVVVIAKLPPLRWLEPAVRMYKEGVRAFHCCNTMWTPGGGLSGKPLKPYSLWAVQELRQLFGAEVSLVGGGGVTHQEDVEEYRKAGADHVAVASVLLNPFNWSRVRRLT